MKMNNILYVLKTARCYAAIAQSMHSNYYMGKARECLRLAHILRQRPESSLTIYFKS